MVFIYTYVHKRCEPLKSLLSAQDAEFNNNGYTCQAVEVPQVFEGQPYYDTAYWRGFGVMSAWGTYSASNWTEYCGGLMEKMTEVATFEESVITSTTPIDIEWEYTFENTAGGTEECKYTTRYFSNLNTLPNAPGGPLRCSLDGILGPCQVSPGVEVEDGSEIVGAVSFSEGVDQDSPFCPDTILWDRFSVQRSPLDTGIVEGAENYIPNLCRVWGQDVGIVSKAVQSCSKELCVKWYRILADASALALTIEVALVLLIVLSFKVNEYFAEKKRHEQSSGDGGGDGEEKDGDEEKGQEDGEREIKSLVMDAGKAVYAAGKTVKAALA